MIFEDLIGKHSDKDILVVGSANTLRVFEKQIKTFIERVQPVTIGINNMTHILCPDYHMWTNNKRLKDFGGCIKGASQIILGGHIKPENMKYVQQDFIVLPYTDRPGETFGWRDGMLRGYYRTCGNLAIYVAHLMGARNIWCVGMDAYSQPYQGSQHCYGKGFTDSKDMEYCRAKDNVIVGCMDSLKESGVDFKIITPTGYKDHYQEGIL